MGYIDASEAHMWWCIAAALAEPGWVGRWQNESGSELEVQAVADGQVTGRYRTDLGAPEETSWFPVTGSVNGDQVAFVVSWGTHGSLTAWVGQRIGAAEDERLRTLWHLTRDVPDAQEEEDVWSSVISGFAVFRRVTPPAP
jgi:hypothetical protein